MSTVQGGVEMSRTPWIVYEGNDFGRVGRCLRCDKTLTLQLPINLRAFILYTKAFVAEHENCERKP